jgi:hypothetical protein
MSMYFGLMGGTSAARVLSRNPGACMIPLTDSYALDDEDEDDYVGGNGTCLSAGDR